MHNKCITSAEQTIVSCVARDFESSTTAGSRVWRNTDVARSAQCTVSERGDPLTSVAPAAATTNSCVFSAGF